MENLASFSRSETIIRTLSVILAGFGVCVFALPLENFLNTRSLPVRWALLFQILFNAIVLLIGGWLLRSSWLGWHHRSARSVRHFCATLVVAVGLCGGMGIDGEFHPSSATPPLSEVSRRRITETAALFAGTVAYFVISRLLVRGLGLKDERSMSEQVRSVKRWLGFITFFFWTSSVIVLDKMAKEHGELHILKEPWGLIALLGPILLAGVIFKLGVRLLRPSQPGRSLAV